MLSVLILVLLLHTKATDPQAVYQAARYQEDVMGDLEAAIQQYQAVIAMSPKSRIAALAQVRLGICYEKRGEEEDMQRAGSAYASPPAAYPEVQQIALIHNAQLIRRRTLMPELIRTPEQEFIDDFEAPQIGPFWKVRVENPNGASIRLGNEQYRSGRQSLHLYVEKDLSVGRQAKLYHDYPPGTQGEWSIYYYDSGSLNPALYTSGYSSMFYVRGTESSLGLYKDSRLIPGYYLGALPRTPPIPTGIPVSRGWHHFRIRVDNYGAKIFIDGLQQAVYNDQLKDVTYVSISYGGSHFAPDDYWDDFRAVLFRPLAFTEIGEYTAGFVGDSPSAAWMDINRDGLPDVYASILGENVVNALALNQGPGQSFNHIIQESGMDVHEQAIGAAWQDYDRDGDPDLYVASDQPGGSLYRNDGGLRFSRANVALGITHSGQGRYPLWADFNGDGWPDLYIAGVNKLYRNLEGQRFVDNTDEAGLPEFSGSAFGAYADYDQDGVPDLYLAGSGSKAGMYHNLGDGRFRQVASQAGLPKPSHAHWAAWGDMDADEWPDLYLLTRSGGRLFHNRGGATFEDVSASAGVDVPQGVAASWGDYDQDGFPDLYVLSAQAPWEQLYHNNRDGTFTEMHREAGMQALGKSRQGRYAVWVDYDSDGDLDLYVTTNAKSNVLYRNNGKGGGAITKKPKGNAQASGK